MEKKRSKRSLQTIIKMPKYIALIATTTAVCIIIILTLLLNNRGEINAIKSPSQYLKAAIHLNKSSLTAEIWKAPDTGSIPGGEKGAMIRYGRELLAHTANYFGPKGSVAQISNGMNCQNCHLDGGTRLFGNNYGGFISSYPKMSNRSGRVEPASERIAECFERSLAGKVPDTSGREIQAMLAYMKWLGNGVKKGQKLLGTSTEKLAYMDVAADPAKGHIIYVAKCKSCHGANGEGLLAADKRSYTYPPLWGIHSYNDGAGMYRIANFAGFIKNNMPFGATYQNPQLSSGEAWNVAAYVNSQPRPHRDQHSDWQNLKKKPVDAPFGPYIDKFSEQQHKYGPFKPITYAQNKLINKS